MAIVDEGLTVRTMNHNGIVLLELEGELTALAAPVLDAAVDGLLAGPRLRNLQLGLRGVPFIDSGGLRALELTRQRATDAGIPMQLLGPSRQVRRLLVVAGLRSQFDVIE